VDAVSGLDVVVVFDQTNAIEVRALFQFFPLRAVRIAIVSDV
jgi:hypothetical protein